MLGGLGAQELLLVLVILALLFGGARVGELGGALGRGVREFRSEASKQDDTQATDEPPASSEGPSEVAGSRK
jgi:sec-independent protein translocase protein TatA